ncbi:MAG TPA: RnfH family protein [Verrucomicrobiae bacterium]|nr:RnfH family protein [Verrucomicrobiae bacterium]
MELRAEVVVALPDRQRVVRVTLPAPATLADAIRRSGILGEFPEIELACCGIGVFGSVRAMDAALKDGDRVEIYRPLPVDPREMRRRRAKAAT